VDLFVRPLDLEDREEPCFMISFQKSQERKPPDHGEDIQNYSNGARTRVKDLQEELQNCREDMQSMAEKYEAANEELKSSNEELQSTNEELKSTNEELETAKEELQSINEEQTTLNSELQAKNKELESINNDMMNLMAATRIATLFLDNDLQIRRFTPAMKDIISLRESDEGRPVREMSMKLEYESLEQDAEQVLADLNSVEREVRGKEGNWYQLRLMPYRTRDNVINGVVMTLNNITHLKENERQAHEAQRFAESVINTVQEPLLILDQDLRVESTNQAFLKTFRTKRDQTEGRSLYSLGHGQWKIPELKELLEEVIPEETEIVDYAVQHEFPSIGLKRIYLNALAVPMEEGASRRILLVVTRVEDIDHQPL
ncbi:MAG: PAS domain-containing protein, partial [Desulfohalobiaceae bacterium]|nr:PAS domain-containing protein [Desulfohalobiaceae bacterium]